MQIVSDKTQYHKYAFEFDYDDDVVEYCRYLKELFTWKGFNFVDDKWRFNDTAVIQLIKNKYPNVLIEGSIFDSDMSLGHNEEKKELVKDVMLEQLRSSNDSSIVIPGLKKDLFPYQKAAVEFIDKSGGRAILAMDMGTGKTATSLAYLAYKKYTRVLVICPASVKYNWENEVRKWTKMRPFVISPDTKMSEIPTDANVVIINYDLLKRFYKNLIAYRWDSLILDEVHMVKSLASFRSKATRLIARHIDSIVMLSGTPFLNRPVELFVPLQMVNPDVWSNYYDYTRQYCDGKMTRFGWEARGATNMDDLQKKISKFFFRKTKLEVLPDLPPKLMIDYSVDLPQESLKEYRKAETTFVKFLKDKNKSEDEIVKILQAEKLTKINYLRQITSLGKVDACAELINELVDGGEKVVVFSVYQEPIRKLQDMFKSNSVCLLGDTDLREREQAIYSFQNDPNVKIFFGGLKSAGTGITLTAASTVIFIDYSFVPADHSQGADRIARIGQKADKIKIYQMYCRNTLDEYMKKVIAKKQAIFDKLIDGKIDHESEGSIIRDLLESMKETL